MSDPVPAITEAAATGEVAKIFGDIRRVLAVDVVNLIWRHLATLDGALPWAWTTLRPLYVDGTIAAEARALHADIDLHRCRCFLQKFSLRRAFTSPQFAISWRRITTRTRWR